MRIRQLTDAEADAQKASETMGIAPALMAIAAVILIGYPAAGEVPRPDEHRHPDHRTDAPSGRRRQGAPPCRSRSRSSRPSSSCRDRMDDGAAPGSRRRRGELTGSVIFLAALAVAAAAVAAIIVAKLQLERREGPG